LVRENIILKANKLEIKKFNRRIKRLIFFLFLVLIPIHFGIEKQDFITEKREQVTQKPTGEPEIAVTSAPKPPYRTKPKKPKKPDKKPMLNLQPLEKGEIGLLSVNQLYPDMFGLISGSELLAAKTPSSYKKWQFYIPPVDYKMKPKDLILPASLIAIGALASHTEKFRDIIPITRPNPQERETPFEDIFQFFVAPSVFAFDAIGKEKHHPIDQLFVSALSYGIMVIPVRYIKAHYDADRPYGGNHSFPSGHTAAAFVGSHVIYKEFKDTNPWIAYTGYAMGTIVAGARVINDRHWVADVLAGAGIAILSTELAYMIYFPIRNFLTNEANNIFGKYIIISPMVHPEGLGMNLSVRF
jgi:membrane-associated phospholipid phosphatase